MVAKVDWRKKLEPAFHLDQGIEQLYRDAPILESRAHDIDADLAVDPILADLAENVVQLRTSAESIITRAEILRQNKIKTELGREKDVATVADSRMKTALPRVDQTRNLTNHRIAELLKEAMPKSQPHDAEVRSVLRAMTADDRRKACDDLDPATASAVLTAPAIASGLTKAQHDAVLNHYRARHHPHTVKRVDRARRALDMHERASSAFLKLGLKVVDRKKMQAALEAEARADEARREDG